MPTALVPVADGSEDIEFATITDILTRADIDVTVASVMKNKEVTLSGGLKLTANCLLPEVSSKPFDGIFLAGGFAGSENFGKSEELKKFMQQHKAQNKLYGAICAAPPLSLGPLGMLEGVKTATCYPSLETKFPSFIKYSTKNVVKCGNCITSRGPGTAMLFALAAVACLRSKEAAQKISEGLLINGPAVDEVLADI